MGNCGNLEVVVDLFCLKWISLETYAWWAGSVWAIVLAVVGFDQFEVSVSSIIRAVQTHHPPFNLSTELDQFTNTL